MPLEFFEIKHNRRRGDSYDIRKMETILWLIIPRSANVRGREKNGCCLRQENVYDFSLETRMFRVPQVTEAILDVVKNGDFQGHSMDI